MADHPGSHTGLSVQSTQEQRRTSVSSCVERFMAQGMSREDAQARCTDSADKEMGTQESRRR